MSLDHSDLGVSGHEVAANGGNGVGWPGVISDHIVHTHAGFVFTTENHGVGSSILPLATSFSPAKRGILPRRTDL